MKTFINVAQMKLATLQAGQFVETGGYYVKGDAGQAKYLIVAAQAADGYGDHTLVNGTVAVLQKPAYANPTLYGAVGDKTTNDYASIVACLAVNDEIELVSDYNFESTLVLTGKIIRGNGFELYSRTYNQITCTDSELQDMDIVRAYTKHVGGDYLTYNVEFKDQTATAATLIQSLVTEGTFKCLFTNYQNGNYGILRQGATGEGLTETTVSNCRFYKMAGDAIEFNVCPNDLKTTVSHIYINDINKTKSTANVFWGIGIGFAGGGGYSTSYPDAELMTNIVLHDVEIHGCRQPVHFEKCKYFTATEINVYPDDTAAVGSGLQNKGVVVYGSADFTIDGVHCKPVSGDGGLGIQWGVMSGAYLAPCVNYTLRNITLIDCDMELYCGGSNRYARVSGVSVSNGDIFYKGSVDELTISDIQVTGGSSSIELEYTTGEGVGVLGEAYPSVVNITNVNSFDVNKLPSGSSSGMRCDKLEVENSNIFFEKTALAQGFRGAPVVKSNVYYYNFSTVEFPYGIEFNEGDLVTSTDGTTAAQYIVTTAGHRTVSTDHIRATTIGDTVIETSNRNWNSRFWKSYGCKITIPGAGAGGADLETTIIKAVFLTGANYSFTISDPVVTATLDNLSIIATNEVAFVAL